MSLQQSADLPPQQVPHAGLRTLRHLHIAIWGPEAPLLARCLLSDYGMQRGAGERVSLMPQEPPEADHQALRDAINPIEAKQNLWFANALSVTASADLCLLLPPAPGAHTRCEILLRQILADAGIAFQVLYGNTSQERLRHAANAIALKAKAILPAREAAFFEIAEIAQPVRLRNWSCEKCSDPDCEHRLFSALQSAKPL